MITLGDVEAAKQKVLPYIICTPLMKHREMSELFNTNLYLKMELFQHTGSFKPRGAFNQILRLDDEQRERGVVAVSGGNFAQAVAYAGLLLGVKTTICMPAYTPANYLDATRGFGAEVLLLPDMPTAFATAEALSKEGRAYLHPFDDANQIAGCGTLGLEILEDVPQVSDVLLSIGGGGLIAGVAVALKAIKPDVRIWGVETELSPAMHEALKAGQPVPINPKSLAKTLGAPIAGKLPLEILQQHLEELILVSDAEAIEAQRYLLEHAKVLTELAASCTLAAAHRIKERFGPEDHVVMVLCGGNESLENINHYPRS